MELQDSTEQQGAAQAGSAAAEAVGATLREARERMGMSVEEVAGRLKFAPRQVAALEAGDFAQLPELAFIRGFVRSYARLLQLDDKPLLDALPGAPAPAAIQVKKAGGEVPRQGAERMQQNLFWVGAALVVVVLGILAWKFDAGETRPAAGSAANPAQTGAAQPGAEVTPAAGQAQPDAATAPSAGASESSSMSPSAGAAQSPEAATEPATAAPAPRATGMPQSSGMQQSAGAQHPPAAQQSTGAAHAGDKKAAPVAPHVMASAAAKASAVAAAAPAKHKLPAAPAAAAASSPEAASAVSATGEGAAHAPRASRSLHFEFSEDSWVEVTDGNGRMLLSTLGKQGGSLNASGPPPLSVVVGNAKGVKLVYKGQPVPLRPMAGSEVARLKLE